MQFSALDSNGQSADAGYPCLNLNPSPVNTPADGQRTVNGRSADAQVGRKWPAARRACPALELRSAEQRLRELFARRMASTHGPRWQDEMSTNVRKSLEVTGQQRQTQPPSSRPDSSPLASHLNFMYCGL
jgi:hypothetical protein